MKMQHEYCLMCGGQTIADPRNKDAAMYCPVCDAAWRQRTCVVCGEAFLVDVERHRGDHHCDPEIEEQIEASRRRQHAGHRHQPHSLSARLKDGFRLMGYER